MLDPNVRKLVLSKNGYTTYCSQCPYRIKAEWSQLGEKYNMIDVYCCVRGGYYIDSGTICPHGVGYNMDLGDSIDFNPSDWTEERFVKPENLYTTLEEVVEKRPTQRGLFNGE